MEMEIVNEVKVMMILQAGSHDYIVEILCNGSLGQHITSYFIEMEYCDIYLEYICCILVYCLTQLCSYGSHEQLHLHLHKPDHAPTLSHYLNIPQRLSYHFHQCLYDLGELQIFFVTILIPILSTLSFQFLHTTSVSDIKDPKHAYNGQTTNQQLHILWSSDIDIHRLSWNKGCSSCSIQAKKPHRYIRRSTKDSFNRIQSTWAWPRIRTPVKVSQII